jgi:thioredoxin 1
MVVAVSEKNFSQEVLEAKAPVIVTFWAPWCGLCRRVEPLISQLQSTATPPLKVVRINADENLRLTKEYRLTTLPTVLLFEQGKLVKRLEGMDGYVEARTAIKQMLEQRPLE